MSGGDQEMGLPDLEGPVVRTEEDLDPAELAELQERRRGPVGIKSVREWGFKFATGDDYEAPEVRGLSVAGVWPDGQRRTSSRIVEKLGPRLFRTASGSYYEIVGDPDPEYVKHCESTGKPLNVADPVRVISGAGKGGA